jgi:hypothetical protein
MQNALVSYNEYRDMSCFSLRDSAGKCNLTNQNYKFVNDLKADQVAGYKRTRRPRPRGKGKVAKDKESKDGSDMEEDPAPKTSEKPEAGASGSKSFKNPKKGAYHTFLGPPMAKAQRVAMRLLHATVPKIHRYAMVVNPLIQGYEFNKCLMDGGSSLNIMYVETLTKLGLTKT